MILYTSATRYCFLDKEKRKKENRDGGNDDKEGRERGQWKGESRLLNTLRREEGWGKGVKRIADMREKERE